MKKLKRRTRKWIKKALRGKLRKTMGDREIVMRPHRPELIKMIKEEGGFNNGLGNIDNMVAVEDALIAHLPDEGATRLHIYLAFVDTDLGHGPVSEYELEVALYYLQKIQCLGMRLGNLYVRHYG